jgi:uncharacterized C2H2 Zn-finger protein
MRHRYTYDREGNRISQCGRCGAMPLHYQGRGEPSGEYIYQCPSCGQVYSRKTPINPENYFHPTKEEQTKINMNAIAQRIIEEEWADRGLSHGG